MNNVHNVAGVQSSETAERTKVSGTPYAVTGGVAARPIRGIGAVAALVAVASLAVALGVWSPAVGRPDTGRRIEYYSSVEQEYEGVYVHPDLLSAPGRVPREAERDTPGDAC